MRERDENTNAEKWFHLCWIAIAACTMCFVVARMASCHETSWDSFKIETEEAAARKQELVEVEAKLKARKAEQEQR